MSDNSTSPCNTQFMEYIFMWITGFCAPCTILFNALVLYIAYKFIDLRTKLNQIFVVSMTVADLVYGMSFMATRPFLDYIPYWLCRPYYVMSWLCQIASNMFLLFLNVDKFISLTFPLHYHAIVTERKVMIQVIVCWLAITIYAIGSAFEPFLYFVPACSECAMSINPHYYVFMIFMCYICPTVISVIISIYIFVLAQHKTRWAPADFPDSKVEHRREKRRLYKRIFFVFSSTVWTAFTSLPYRFGSCAVWLCKHFNQNVPTTTTKIVGADLLLQPNRTFDEWSNYSVSNWSSNIYTEMEDFNYTFFNSTSNNSALSNEELGDPCLSATTHYLVWSFMIILPFGSLGNPLITIITQRAYRQRALYLWSLFLKRLHCPKICIPTFYIAVRRKSKSEDESTKVMELLPDEPLLMPPVKRVSKQNVFELM